MTEDDPTVAIRPVRGGDVAQFYELELDPDGRRMAAFLPREPLERPAFEARWDGLLRRPDVIQRTITVDGVVAGHVARFEMFGKPTVAYWVARRFWGRGVASAAVRAFLAERPERPLYARVAADNAASARVLEKCGFRPYRRERAFAEARGEEIEEVLFVLPAVTGGAPDR